ncbi:MAG: ComEC/Rec2 family competence protein [Christensenellales bacterium]
MANKKNSKKSASRDLIYISIIAVLVIALLVSLFMGDKLGIILGKTEKEDSGNGVVHTSVLSGTGNVSLPSEFDGNNCLEVHFLNVGQGDAIFIMFADGKKMIIDAGSGSSPNAPTAVKTSYFEYLKNNLNLSDGDTVDYLLVTHPDADHVNMASEILDRYDVDYVYYNDFSYSSKPTQTYSTFMEKAVAEPGATVYAIGADSETYSLSGEGYSMDVYASGYNTFYEEAVENNNRNILSIMCVLTYGGRKVMFTGDAEVPTEKWFMDTVGGSSLDVDVLKVGHHGSSSCTSKEFLDFIKPEYAVISCDNGKAYHHPHPETMNSLFDYGVVTYRTNRHGNTVLYIADDGDFGFLTQNAVAVENNSKNLNPLTITLK